GGGWEWRGRVKFCRRKKFESDMDAELSFHIDAYVEDLVRSGLDRAEARRRARIEFGAVEATKDDCRQVRGLQRIDELRADLRLTFRALRNNPSLPRSQSSPSPSASERIPRSSDWSRPSCFASCRSAIPANWSSSKRPGLRDTTVRRIRISNCSATRPTASPRSARSVRPTWKSPSTAGADAPQRAGRPSTC